MILDDIILSKQQEVEAAKSHVPLEDLKIRIAGRLAERGFRKAVSKPGQLNLVAELKRKSPSKGMLRERFDPISLGQQLQEAGAAALSVLTDEPFFGGHLEFLRDVHQFTDIPTLRKDFIIDPYQIYEAVYYRADAVLLIVQLLDEDQLFECVEIAERLELDALVEVHSESELQIALSVQARIIGINVRDLRNFTIQPDTVERLVPKIPAGKIIVAESGIQTREDIQRLKTLGVHAVLIGEALMTAPDPAAKVRELFAP